MTTQAYPVLPGHAGWFEQEATEATEEKGAVSLFSQFPPVDLAA